MSKVTCPLCKRQFKEINNAHLNTHQMTISEYDILYPNHPRMSIDQRKMKARYNNLTPEMSAKLKFSQTVEGFMLKYGNEEGVRRWELSNDRKSKSKTLDSYIGRHGDIEGTKLYEQLQDTHKTKMTLECFVQRLGKEEGHRKFVEFTMNNKKSKTLEYYQLKYGTEDGTKRWELKNLRNSRSSMKIPPSEQDSFKLYKLVVDRITRQTIKQHEIVDISIREKGKFSLDHKFSVLEGFRNNIPPYIISSKYNLEIIPHSDNSSKQEKCSITLPELFSLVFD